MIEATDSAYEAAKTAYTLYGWLLQEAAVDLGWEKVIAIQARVGGSMGEVLAGMLHARCGEHKLDTVCVSAVLENVFKGMGIDYELQTGENSVTGHYKRCPIYDGLAASGIAHAAIQQVCEGFGADEGRKLQQVFPEITLTTRFRERAEDACMEEFAVAK